MNIRIKLPRTRPRKPSTVDEKSREEKREEVKQERKLKLYVVFLYITVILFSDSNMLSCLASVFYASSMWIV